MYSRFWHRLYLFFFCFLVGNYIAPMESLFLLPSDSGRILELLEGGLLSLQLQHLQPGLQLFLRLSIIEEFLIYKGV